MDRILFRSAALVLLVSLFSACQPDGNTTATEVKPEPALPPAPPFNADSAYAFVAKQVSFGPRVPGSAAHKACGDWMVGKLKSYGATVIEQTGTVIAFNGQPTPLRNIIASWQPEVKERVLLMAHWDSRPYADHDTQRQNEPIDGANDGGSGVGIWMELARHMMDLKPTIGVDIFFTDVEDMGQPHNAMGGGEEAKSLRTWCLGSQYWVKNLQPPNYRARFGILLDMCGSVDARFPREALSVSFASQVVNKIWKAAAAVGHGDRFLSDTRHFVGIDDHLIVNEGTGIPVADIIAFDDATQAFPSSWHTHADNMSGIDKATLEAVGTTMMQVVWSER